MNDVTLRPKEIVRRAFEGRKIPRIACGPLAVHYCAGLSGVSVKEYTTDARVLSDCIIEYYEQFRPDAVWVSADTWVTAEAMGATVGFPGDNTPPGGIGKHLVRTPADIDRIPLPDPSSQGRMPLMLEALRRVNEALGADIFIVACFDQYPFSLACATMGIEPLMIKLLDDQPFVEALMEKCFEFTTAYAMAMAAEGADMLSGGDSPAGLIGPMLYREVALPFERRVTEKLRTQLALPISLHICGDATPILADIANSGANVIELDHQVAIEQACQVVGSDVVIWGNLDPVGLLSQSDASNVQRATCELLNAILANGHRRFVLSSGCTLAVETPAENLRAMFDVARNYECPARENSPPLRKS
jgi:uroporphyrinogen decarboxylase